MVQAGQHLQQSDNSTEGDQIIEIKAQGLQVLQRDNSNQPPVCQEVGVADLQVSELPHVAPDEHHGSVTDDAVPQNQAFQLLQVWSCSSDPHISDAVGAAKAQCLQVVLRGNVNKMMVRKGGNAVDGEVSYLWRWHRGGDAEPGVGDVAEAQLQCGDRGGHALVRDTAEVGLGQAQAVELGTAVPQGRQQCRGQEPLLAAGAGRAPQPQGAQAARETVAHQVPQRAAGDLGGKGLVPGDGAGRAPLSQWGDSPPFPSAACSGVT